LKAACCLPGKGLAAEWERWELAPAKSNANNYPLCPSLSLPPVSLLTPGVSGQGAYRKHCQELPPHLACSIMPLAAPSTLG